MSDCPHLEKCGFFNKYRETKNLACRGFLNNYCQGSKQDECKRKEYRQLHGTPPSDDMMPNGHTIAA